MKPGIPDDAEERTLWFTTWHKATHCAHKWGLHQKPELREAWVDYAWRKEWSLRVPIDGKVRVRNNARGNNAYCELAEKIREGRDEKPPF